VERALAITRRAYGEQHPDVAWTLLHVGSALQRANQLEQARGLLERALDMVDAAPNQPHPQAVPVLTALALTLRGLGEPVEARKLLERAFGNARLRFGPDRFDNPTTRGIREAHRRLQAPRPPP
jgi:tetratricopeptide (TPR) repeat protein